MNTETSDAVNHERRKRVTFAVTYLLIAIVATVVGGSMLWIYNAGHRMMLVQVPLTDAAMQIQAEATIAHLWFEEALSGDTTVEMDEVLHHIDSAKWYANAMLEGGENADVRIMPLTDPHMLDDIRKVLANIERFRDITVQRWAEGSQAGIGSEIDQQYDAIFEDFLQDAENVKADLQTVIARDLSRVSTLQITLIIIAVSTMLAVAVFFTYFLQRQIADADRLRGSNQQLRAAEQQLQAASQQLESNNQQLIAGEQQLRAANEQLTASEQQLRASNQQLTATNQQLTSSEQQLGAVNQQLTASEQQLRASNQQLRANQVELAAQNKFLSDVFESLKHPFYVVNPDTYRIEMANSASNFGSLDEAATCHSLTHGTDRPCDQNGHPCPIENIRRTGKPITVEHHHIVDGEERFVEVHAYPVIDSRGKVAKIIESVLDITERKEAERKIEDLAKFPSENPNPVLRLSKDGEILFANKASKALLEHWRCGEGDMLPDKWAKFSARVLAADCSEQTEIDCEGEWLSLTFAPVSKLGYTNIYALDITARKKALREIEQLAKFPSENPNPVMRVLKDATVAYANDAGVSLLDHWGCKVGGSLPAVWVSMVAEAFKTDQTKVAEIDVGDRSLSLRFTPISDLGYLNVYGLDTTDRVRAEQQIRQAMTDLEHTSRLITVGEMATGLAHELNQPLCAILNYANTGLRTMKKEAAGPEKVYTVLEQIAFQADRAGEIIRRLRTLVSKHEASRSRICVNDIVKDVLALQESEARQRKITVTTDLDADIPPVLADSVQIEQALLNFVRNAFDSMDEASPENPALTVRTGLRAGQVEITVIDNGKGLAQGEDAKVFDSFYTTKPNGLGIGLSLTRSIIEAHNGTFRAEQNKDAGASFSFTLPVEK